VKACAATASWPQLGRDGVDAAELLGQLEGALGLAAVDQEAAGLPTHPAAGHAGPTGRRPRGLDQHSAAD
jgi:hypothetical protein